MAEEANRTETPSQSQRGCRALEKLRNMLAVCAEIIAAKFAELAVLAVDACFHSNTVSDLEIRHAFTDSDDFASGLVACSIHTCAQY